MANVDLYSDIIMRVSNALNTLVSREKPGFQAPSKGLIVLLCAEVVRQGVPDHGMWWTESTQRSGRRRSRMAGTYSDRSTREITDYRALSNTAAILSCCSDDSSC